MRNIIRMIFVSAAASAALTANALTLFDSGTTGLVSGDPTQLGRLGRDGVPSDWSTAKTFPGVINTGTTYHYHVYDVNVGITNFVQVSIDDPDAVIFTSAYSSTYDASNKNVGYMGDAGSSGNPFGNPGSFQVVAALNSTIHILVNEVNTNGAIGHNYDILVEGFIDNQYSDPVPEPMTLGAVSLAGIAALRRRRSNKS